jgi:uncharacterized protein YprB with RNaseH-like and TPR domain
MKHRENEFRGRLQRLRRLAPAASGREPGRGRALSLGDIEGAVEQNGVLVLERSVGDLVSTEAVGRLLSGIELAGRSARERDHIEEDLKRLTDDPQGALFVDTETTGLGGSMVFLLGAMRIEEGDMVLRQVFARDYREEPALLTMWTDMLATARLLVSFNGKAFDLPVLRDRLGFHGVEPPAEPPHLDLLHASRRRWREVFPDCRLQTLEWRICGRRRAGDIPGEEIPAVYHRFVRTGEPEDILTVFHHNALDLITLGDLALALALDEGGRA